MGWEWVAGLWGKLFGSRGGSQIGGTNTATSGNTVGDNASGVVVGNNNVVTNYPPPTREEIDFTELEAMMPGLLAEMKKDLAQHPLVRELVVLNTKGNAYNGGPVLIYYHEDHPDLLSKLHVLENHGLIRDIKFNQLDRFRITEAFARYLLGSKATLSVQAKGRAGRPAPAPPRFPTCSLV